MANEVDSKTMDETKEMPDSVFKALGEMGLFGLQIPEELGGLGLSNTGYARVVEEVAVDPSLTLSLLSGATGPLSLAHFLRPVANWLLQQSTWSRLMNVLGSLLMNDGAFLPSSLQTPSLYEGYQ